jgi:hypothetical protein
MKYFNCHIASSLFSSFQENTKCESSSFADTCTHRIPIFYELSNHPVTSSVFDADHQVNKTVKTIKLDKNDLVTSTKPNPKISNANNMTLPIPKLCETTSNYLC